MQTTLTLAQLIKTTRESLSLSTQDLCEKIQMPVETIEEIEAGIQLFLSPSQRQKLARGLKLLPQQIKNLEKEFPNLNDAQDKIFILEVQVKRNPHQNYQCPKCGSGLNLRQFDRKDIDDNDIVVYKLNCQKCPFQHAIE